MMEYSLLPRCILASFIALAFSNAFIVIPHTPLQRSVSLLSRAITNDAACCNHISSKLFLFENDKGDTGPKNDITSRNEFSRTIRVSKWFDGGVGSSSNRRGSNRKMDLSIAASPSECNALATRFRLTNITSLSADMVVQPVLGLGNDSSGRGSGYGDGSECIEARGTVCAQVTQTCVRTNEKFDVSLEFSFDTILRAMSSRRGSGIGGNKNDAMSAGEMAALDAASKMGSGRSQKKKGANKQRVKDVRGGQSVDDIGMKQLQDMLMEHEVTDEIIEDESCFCTDGIVDCGEIVAQMFRSKLDPYPKKPGTDPVSYSFTF